MSRMGQTTAGRLYGKNQTLRTGKFFDLILEVLLDMTYGSSERGLPQANLRKLEETPLLELWAQGFTVAIA